MGRLDMKCKCGNEQGKPRVSPYPIQFKDEKSKEMVQLPYMGGFVLPWNLCWFCAFPSTIKDRND